MEYYLVLLSVRNKEKIFISGTFLIINYFKTNMILKFYQYDSFELKNFSINIVNINIIIFFMKQ